MYLVSIYFDEKAEQRILQYIKQVAKSSRNPFMLDTKVPAHITIAAFETKDEEAAIVCLKEAFKAVQRGKLQWVSVGQFFPYVIYLTPVLNEYLHGLSVQIHAALSSLDDVKISPFYRPFQWLPHTTIGKKLAPEEMFAAFEVMRKNFSMFEGEVVRIGLARTNPYQDILSWEIDF